MLLLLQGCGNLKDKNPETLDTTASNILQDSSPYTGTEKNIGDNQNLSQDTETKNLTTNNLESKSSQDLLSKNSEVKTPTSASEAKEKPSSKASQRKESDADTKVIPPGKKPEDKPDKPQKIIKIPKDVDRKSVV